MMATANNQRTTEGRKSAAVSVKEVCKTYGSGDSAVVALRSVSMEANCGEMLMMVGPSGCGKTTLLSVLCGTLKVDSGQISVFGQEIVNMPQGKLTRFRGQHIGFIFQQFNLIPTISVLENASVPLLLNGKSRKQAEAIAAEVLTEVGLGDKLKMRPSMLSGGQQQRVAIARALVHQPRLIICDEPTASLDAATGHHVMELLKKVACGEDRCVIVVTHDNRIFSFADRIAEMEDGMIKGIHSPSEFIHH